MSPFVFESYEYEFETGVASFRYSVGEYVFCEKLTFFTRASSINQPALERALFLAFIVIGTSYFKTFPTPQVSFMVGAIDDWQAAFLNAVYQEGLSQYAFENSLVRDNLAQFSATTSEKVAPVEYDEQGVIALQSGGKDSLLTAVLLEQAGESYAPLYVTSGSSHPAVLDSLSGELLIVRRDIDRSTLQRASTAGALNGHVPVTYIVQSIALLQAILLNASTVVASIGHEGEEPHAQLGDLAVTHQWSKTWPAEQLFSEYVARYVSPDIRVGSPLRGMSELTVSKLFAERAWQRFGHAFSSCNRANYGQGANNQQLSWCGDCPKCANAFLLFAPFVDYQELTGLFGGRDLFAQPSLAETFKGLLGVDGVMKPFECVGEIDELRYAYHLSDNTNYQRLPFAVPVSTFDPAETYPAQDWATALVQRATGTI